MSQKTYLEAASELPIYDECDVLVVGGGAAGHSAAIAAARAGCEKVILMERFGYFGGDVTGGYVLMIPALELAQLQLCPRYPGGVVCPPGQERALGLHLPGAGRGGAEGRLQAGALGSDPRLRQPGAGQPVSRARALL